MSKPSTAYPSVWSKRNHGAGRRKRVRQDDFGPGDTAPRTAHGRQHFLRRSQCERTRGGKAAPLAGRDADHLPRSVLLCKSEIQRLPVDQGTLDHAQSGGFGVTERKGPDPHKRSGVERRTSLPVSPPVFRRAAPAHRCRQVAGVESEFDSLFHRGPHFLGG